MKAADKRGKEKKDLSDYFELTESKPMRIVKILCLKKKKKGGAIIMKSNS